MSAPQPNQINGITFTTKYSYISVLYTPTCLIVDFPYDKKIIDTIKSNIPGAKFNALGNYKWTLPKDASKKLGEIFSTKILSFKTQEEIKRDASFFSFKEETLAEIIERIPKKIETPFMKIPPKNFQKVAIGWIATQKGKRGNVYGGILGDTMGLGKTIQALASAAYLKHQGKIKRCLIVTEAGLKTQWAEETEVFTNESYIVIDGAGKEEPYKHRRKQLQSVKENDIFYTITNYDLLTQREKIGEEEVIEKGKTKKKQIKGDYTDLKVILENEYDMIILDEAQKIRNLNTTFFKAIHQIQSPKYRLIMTGTPIEKEIENIFPLIDYLSPNIFSDASIPIEQRKEIFEDLFLTKKLNPHALPKRVPEPSGVKNLSILNKFLGTYMLRRTIDDVSDEMPSAEVQVMTADWEKNQFDLYNDAVELLKLKNEEWGDAYKAENTVFAQLEEKRRRASSDPRARAEVMKLQESFQNLQKQRILLENEVKALRLYSVEICNTPELILWSESPIAHRLLKHNDFYYKIHKKAQKIRKDPTLDEKQMEEKLHVLFEKEVPAIPKLEMYIEEVVKLCLFNEEKVITFTKFETMSRILERKIKKAFFPDKDNKKKKKAEPLAATFMYTGATKKGCQWKSKLKREGTPVENPSCSECPFLEKCNTRRKAQWHLQNDPFTKLLIATDAANAGVNLQSARYNFNYDLPDSPAKYNQRNGRIQRIGSPHKNVFFINLVTAEGIDAAKYDKIVRKQSNIDVAIELTEAQKKLLSQTAEEIEDDYEDDVDLTEDQDIINQLKTIKK